MGEPRFQTPLPRINLLRYLLNPLPTYLLACLWPEKGCNFQEGYFGGCSWIDYHVLWGMQRSEENLDDGGIGPNPEQIFYEKKGRIFFTQ